MHITGSTRITGLFGYPVGHTLSPAMQNAAFSHCGLDYCYLPFSVRPENLKNALEAIRSLGLAGVNLTVPHKEAALPFLDRLDEEASAIGAVNTITSRDNLLTGYNTDGKGFVMSLREHGIALEKSRALIIGAGGASRAIAYYLGRSAIGLHLFNRNRSKAEDLASHLARYSGTVDVISGLSSVDVYDIIIHATPLGLKKDDPPPLDTALLRPGQVVCDLIYHQTPLLRAAAARGCHTIDGLGMLLWQGAYAFELWTGINAPVEVMRTALLSLVK